MRRAPAWTIAWEATGATLSHTPGNGQPTDIRHLTHADIAALTDYDARMLGLPPVMEAMLVVQMFGRIDHPSFRVELRLEPFLTLHDWAVTRRDGARLFVGERSMRLNAHQLAVFEACDAMHAAAGDVAARLRAWPALEASLRAPQHARVLVRGAVPRLHIRTAAVMPDDALTRMGARLVSAKNAAWGMLANRKYLLSAR